MSHRELHVDWGKICPIPVKVKDFLATLVREARLELACPFGRHPLKMVCLPVPPLALLKLKFQFSRRDTVGVKLKKAFFLFLLAFFVNFVSLGGLEPPALCLKGRCSTPELQTRHAKWVTRLNFTKITKS
jgi:hypothetical protein